MTVLKFAPDRPMAAYKVRGSFSIDADAPEEAVKRAYYQCGQAFIRELEQQGWRSNGELHLDPRPHPHYEPVDIPARGVQDRYAPATYVQTPNTHEGRVDYKFWGIFIRKEIPNGSRN